MDVMMPENGMEALRKYSENPELSNVLITFQQQEGRFIPAVDTPVDDYITNQ
jgi:CheY-like chemotaxis protein